MECETEVIVGDWKLLTSRDGPGADPYGVRGRESKGA